MVALHHANHDADTLIVELVEQIEVSDDLHCLHPHEFSLNLVVLFAQIVGHVAEILEKSGFTKDFLIFLTWYLVNFIDKIEYLHRQSDNVLTHDFEQSANFECR